MRGRKLVVVSNREPVLDRLRDGKIERIVPASGLTTAMLPLVSAANGTWIAHGSGDADFAKTDARDGIEVVPDGDPSRSFRLRRVRLTGEVEQGYYYGYSNE